MLGWINDCIEKLVLEKFGEAAWHEVKRRANCDVEDGGFFKLESYTDKSTMALVAAASEVSGLTKEQVLEVFGEYFVDYIRGEGYDRLLCCQGRTLKDFLTNINEIHEHLQNTFPKKILMPQFWCEDSDKDDSLILHYHSQRGNMFVPLAKGLVCEISKSQFEVELQMDLIRTQGVHAKMTSWRVNAKNPDEQWKLRYQESVRFTRRASMEQKSSGKVVSKCPFTGIATQMDTSTSSTDDDNSVQSKSNKIRRCSSNQTLSTSAMSKMASDDTWTDAKSNNPAGSESGQIRRSPSNQTLSTVRRSPSNQSLSTVRRSPSNQTLSTSEVSGMSSDDTWSDVNSSIGFSGKVARKVFPYHIVFDQNNYILQVGELLPKILSIPDAFLLGESISEFIQITKPLNACFSPQWIKKLKNQSFEVELVDDDNIREQNIDIRLKASMLVISQSPYQVMLIMTPDARNLVELQEMNLTLSDLPVHGAYRDAVFLREHLSSQMNNALRMEKLARSLKLEKSLLESMIPKHAADGLRTGKSVEPMMHDNVTIFFSDIVGFTSICKEIEPWQIVNMLDQLYSVMDHLVFKFHLYKIETIGDAYVCCSGLPEDDPKHAENVANFAIAVSRCCKQVLSPLAQEPIELRIGIHTGPCASGMVGKTSPRYCVFGDTVNTAARHESTGKAGKVHCSKLTYQALQLNSATANNYKFTERGFVEMKGKGKQLTYWLESSELNPLVNEAALQLLDEEVKKLLSQNDELRNSGHSKNALKALEKSVQIASPENDDFTFSLSESISDFSVTERDFCPMSLHSKSPRMGKKMPVHPTSSSKHKKCVEVRQPLEKEMKRVDAEQHYFM